MRRASVPRHPVFYRVGTPVLRQVCPSLKPKRQSKRCRYTHDWMALIKLRRGRRRVNRSCPLCQKCIHTWHANKINKKRCPACAAHPCAAKCCGHVECIDCGIGHGTIAVTARLCDSCREWRTRRAAA